MTKEKNQFEEMMSDAIDDITAETEKTSSNQDASNPYTLNKELLNSGHDFDNEGVYFHFNETYQAIGIDGNKDYFTNTKAKDNIYLKIARNQDKRLEINFTWCIKENNSFKDRNSFKVDFLLNTGEKKDIKALNEKVSYSGERIGNPSSEGSYVKFVDDMLSQITNSPCLEVFKNQDFEFPEAIDEDETLDDELSDDIQSFDDYDEDIKKEALKVSKEGRLFKELQNSVKLTHQGHDTSRDALILQEASVFVGDGVHGLLDGDSGEGKSDLSFTIGNNFPKKYVKILRNISPKNIYYDCESYNDDYNILIFDDLPLTEDMIVILKELADNTKKIKELRTVINGKSVKFRLEGKFIIILTYAKKIPDEELSNRLFNLGVIVEKASEKSRVKQKIRDNNVIGGNSNPIIERNRLIIKASIHDLIEKEINVFNPFLSIFNPEAYNNRDVNHFINMVKTRSFFDYYERRQIKVNDELTITIGSYEDFRFVNDIWSEDVEAQKFKLSEKQKQILKLLPFKTQDEAFDYVKDLNDEYQQIQSRKSKTKYLEDKPTIKALSKVLGINQNTLRNLLDKSSEHSTVKSLIENGLVDKIQLDEDNPKSPNIYYKIKNDDNVLISSSNDVEDVDFQFQDYFNNPLVKQKIIINLLYYCNILLNEKGYDFLKSYCDDYDAKIDITDYNSYFTMLNDFFEGLNYDEMCIDVNSASLDDLNLMNGFNDEIINAIGETLDDDNSLSNSNDFKMLENSKENPSNQKQNHISILNGETDINKINKNLNRDKLEEINVDFDIANAIYRLLSSGDKTLDEIRSSICKNLNPDDVDSHSLALKVEMNVERLYMNDYIDFYHQKYEILPSFDDLVLNDASEGDD